MAKKITQIIANFSTQIATKLSPGSTTGNLKAPVKDKDGVVIPDGLYVMNVNMGETNEEHLLFTLNATTGAMTGIKSVSRQGVETTGAVLEHRGGAKVYLTDYANLLYFAKILAGELQLDGGTPLEYDSVPVFTSNNQLITKAYADALVTAGAPDSSTSTKGLSRQSYAPDTTIGTATITIASPAVVTKVAHGLTVNDTVKFTTTGALPTGLVAGSQYYVIASGLTADAFQVSSSLGGSAINTSGTQSGTHTLVKLTPVSVATTDPRMLTQAENDAVAGKSGTAVGPSNKLIDDADTSVTAGASKVVRAGADKKIDPAYIQGFAGDGSDGPLVVASGVTNIDLGGAQFVLKQYSSVSITGTGQVTTSNPHVNGTLLVIKSQGDVIMTSSTIPNFDMSGMGGAGGAGGAISNSGSNQTNNGGADATNIVTNFQGDTATSHGKGGATNAVTGGTAGTIFGNLFMYTLSNATLSNRRITIAPGFGGGGGAGGQSQLNGTSAGGAGGRGGGALVIQCGGALNFTSALGIDVSGKNGTSASNVSTSGQTGAGGGGGGGGAGMCLVIYNTLTSATGTVNAKGGNGGAGGNATTTTANGSAAGTGGGGSGGGTYASAGGAGGNGGGIGGGNNGNAGGSPSGGAGGGGGGGASGSGAGTWNGGAGGTSTTSASLWLIVKNYFIA